MKIFLLTVCLSALLLPACKKQNANEPGNEAQLMSNRETNEDKELRSWYHRHNWKTLWELQQVRAATAKYQNINNAFCR